MLFKRQLFDFFQRCFNRAITAESFIRLVERLKLIKLICRNAFLLDDVGAFLYKAIMEYGLDTKLHILVIGQYFFKILLD